MANPIPFDLPVDAGPEDMTSAVDQYTMGEPLAAERPIDKLKKGSELHEKVIKRFKERLEFSEREMSKFYYRWAVNEQKVQAYIHLSDYEKMLKDMTNEGLAPQPVSVVVPFTYAALSTLVTFMVATFLGKRPHWPLGSNSAEGVKNSQQMEIMLQYNSDHTRMIRRLHQKFWDFCQYGFGATHQIWCDKFANRTIRKRVPSIMGEQLITAREYRRVYQGTNVTNIDPYNFFPDPRVPMVEVNKLGEFVCWRYPASRLRLMKEEEEYGWAHIKDIPKTRPRNEYGGGSARRSLLSDGEPHPGLNTGFQDDARFDDDFVQVDQGTFLLVPDEWGLGDGDKPELWILAMGNKGQMIQAEPFDADHDMHPVAISEPTSLGYSFGSASPADYTNTIQDIVSWLVNSHMHNVRSAVNDTFIYDPSAIEGQDLKDAGPGRRYRLKPSAYGRDVRSVISQIPVVDVTAQHMADAEMFMRVGLMLLGLNENVMGAATASSRRSASEARITADASVSRIGLISRLASGQGIVDMLEQMILNIQQNISEDFELQVLGQKGAMESVLIKPENLVGDFYYPISDGTLPMDKIGVMQVWKDLIALVIQDPMLRQEWNVNDMIEFAGEMAGANNISMMRNPMPPPGMPGMPGMPGGLQVAGPEALAQGAAQGQLAPVDPAMVRQSVGGLAFGGGPR